MNRTALNIGLLVVVAALGAAVYFSKDDKQDETTPLTALKVEDISQLVLERPDASPLTLVKQNGSWRLETPVQGRADPFEVASLVNVATQPVYRRLPLAEVNPAELKLAPPLYTLTINGQKLSFGDLDPLEYRRYVQLGDEVALSDDPPATAVDADHSNLVAKELLPVKAGIRSIEVPGLRVTRDAEDRNWVASPASERATAATAARFVEAWRGARAMWNAAMPADGGKGAAIVITLDDEVIRLHLVAREPQLLIDNPALKVRYALSKADAESLLQLVATPAAVAKSAALSAP